VARVSALFAAVPARGQEGCGANDNDRTEQHRSPGHLADRQGRALRHVGALIAWAFIASHTGRSSLSRTMVGDPIACPAVAGPAGVRRRARRSLLDPAHADIRSSPLVVTTRN